MKKILLISLISLTTFAQSYDPNRVLKLDTDLINLFSCSGMVSGNSLSSWDSGIFSDDQMIDIMTFNTTAVELALAEKGIEYYTEYLKDFNEFAEQGFNDILEAIEEGNFTWELQSEIDYCQYKINKIILNQPEKVGSYSMDRFRDAVREAAKERFKFIKQLLNY